MFNLKKMLQFTNQGLSLKEVVIVTLLKQLPPPVNLSTILKINELNLKDRQLRNTINNLQDDNMFVKVRYKNGLAFLFPLIIATNKIYRKFPLYSGIALQDKFGKSLPLINSSNKKQSAILYLKDYIYNKYINNKRNVKDVMSKINNKNKIIKNKLYEEEDITLYIDDNKSVTNYSDNRKLVFDRRTFQKIKDIKKLFVKDFPNRNAFVNCEVPKDINYALLKSKIAESKFLSERNTLGLTWCLKHYEAIINDFYKTYNDTHQQVTKTKNDFSEREYSQEFFNSLYSSLD